MGWNRLHSESGAEVAGKPGRVRTVSSPSRVSPLQLSSACPRGQAKPRWYHGAVSSLNVTALLFGEIGMSSALSRTYDPKAHEERLGAWWERQGFFKPETQVALGQVDPGKPPFVVPMPPPNVTGVLHLGHAIMDAVEDFLVRAKRQQGYPALWIPGTDHAGIATQSIVEQFLQETGSSRQALGREAFEQEVWSWKEEYHSRISGQQRRLGISCDWERERFTLDPNLSRAVRTSFVRLYEEGLIYRGEYLVNWSPKLQTAVSDLEVEYEAMEGSLYTFKYRLQGSDDYIPVATTRPETILGDTGLAVHPEDEKYGFRVGQHVLVPLQDRPIPVVADAAVDLSFGTGAFKITPGHDHTDYEVGRRHGLPCISIFDRDANLNETAGEFAGLSREEGRARIWAAMEAQGLTLGQEPYTVRVPRSQRSGEIIEPMLSTQWFVRMEEMAQQAKEAVATGQIEIVPRSFEKVYFHWLDNIRDWCISRQLWWGHRIPVWYGPDGHMFCAMDEAEAHASAQRHYGRPTRLEQDADVLDTWYSSGLWPFSILGWPEQTADYAQYYPASVLETGYDILFFWVARMIMLGLKLTGQVPFRTVYLHGLVRAEDGKKMSKSQGNTVDPLDVVAEYGSDALRFALLTGIAPGNDLTIQSSRFENNRNFANKVWNAFRFLMSHAAGRELPLTQPANVFLTTYALPAAERLALADRWILARLTAVTQDAERLLATWQIGEMGKSLYDFIWHEFCDWYVEAAKVDLRGEDPAKTQATVQVLAHVLGQSMRYLHPYLPFLTEAVWQELPGLKAVIPTVMFARWDTSAEVDRQAVVDFGLLQKIVRAVRNLRAEYKIDPGRRLKVHMTCRNRPELLTANQDLLTALARLDAAASRWGEEAGAKPDPCLTLTVEEVTMYFPWAGVVDMEAEKRRMQARIDDLQKQLQRAQALLANGAFVSKAPAAVVAREKAKAAKLAREAQQIEQRLQEMQG